MQYLCVIFQALHADDILSMFDLDSMQQLPVSDTDKCAQDAERHKLNQKRWTDRCVYHYW